MIKRWLRKLTHRKEEYPTRFLKFYYQHKKELLQERKALYYQKLGSDICVRCKRPVISGIVFCAYHQQKQKEYNVKARKKN